MYICLRLKITSQKSPFCGQFVTQTFVITFLVWNFECLGQQLILISIAMDLRSNTFQPKKRFNIGKLGICLTKFALLLKDLLCLFWALSKSTTFVFHFLSKEHYYLATKPTNNSYEMQFGFWNPKMDGYSLPKNIHCFRSFLNKQLQQFIN